MNNRDVDEKVVSQKLLDSEFKSDTHSGGKNCIAQSIAHSNPETKAITHNNSSCESFPTHENKHHTGERVLQKQKSLNIQNNKSSNKSSAKVLTSSIADYRRSSFYPKVKPRIFTGPTNEGIASNPWLVKSQFDNMTFKLVPLTKAVTAQEQKWMWETRKLKSITNISSYVQDPDYIYGVKAAARQASQDAFLKSRLSVLRKSPVRIVVPKAQITLSESTPLFNESMTDQIACGTRVDEARCGFARFDPYHSECGSDCRRCFFLMKTLPHIAAKLLKVPKLPDSGKPLKKKQN